MKRVALFSLFKWQFTNFVQVFFSRYLFFPFALSGLRSETSHARAHSLARWYFLLSDCVVLFLLNKKKNKKAREGKKEHSSSNNSNNNERKTHRIRIMLTASSRFFFRFFFWFFYICSVHSFIVDVIAIAIAIAIAAAVVDIIIVVAAIAVFTATTVTDRSFVLLLASFFLLMHSTRTHFILAPGFLFIHGCVFSSSQQSSNSEWQCQCHTTALSFWR